MRIPGPPQLGDGLLAAALAGIGLAWSDEAGRWQPLALHLDPLGYALVVAAALPIVVRRVWPMATLVTTVVATSAYLIIGYPYGPVFLSLIVVVYTAAVLLPSKQARAAGGIALAGMVAHVIARIVGPEGAAALVGLLPAVAWVIAPLAVGLGVRVGRDSIARERADELRRHAYEERLRIAQEVHDVVGHGLAAINMQAEIALHVLPKRPEHAETALEAISRTSKQALDELRATLAILRQDGETSMRLSLARIDELVARVEGAGVPVTVTVKGARRSLPDDVDLAGYRIVQEALTNVLRHAGGAPATVQVAYQPQTVTIEVTDAGAEPAGNNSDGHGIAGMRERVSALGGQFEAGPNERTGFRVYACLPTT